MKMQIKTPFSKEFMDMAPVLLRQGLISPRSSTEFSNGIYTVPLRTDKLTQYGSKGISPTHQGQLSNSIDFFAPEGTEVLAAAHGEVVSLRRCSAVGGTDPSFWGKGNYINISHQRFGESTWYEHLMFNRIFVGVGDTVDEGQLIGLLGNTGFSEIPHLHFQVNQYFGDKEEDFVTVRVRFKHWPENPVYRLDELLSETCRN